MAVAPVADEVDHHVLVEGLAKPEGQAGGPGAGLGIVAVHVEDGRLDHLGHVGRVHRGPRRLGGGGEPELVVDDHVHRAADAVARESREVERLGHHALAGEGRVAVDEDGQHGEPLRRRPADPGVPSVGGRIRSCLARAMPSTTGSTASRCEGLDAMVTASGVPERPVKVPAAPLWYFTSPEPWTDSGSRLPSNSSKISR